MSSFELNKYPPSVCMVWDNVGLTNVTRVICTDNERDQTVATMHAPFCHACGRIISRTAKPSQETLQKYCSKTCKTSKPGETDVAIESRFLNHLIGKVDRKLGVPCTVIQQEYFGDTSEGMEKARERERVRRAGRRIVVFPERLKDSPLCGKVLECVQNGKVVEGSFAKGDWGVRVVE